MDFVAIDFETTGYEAGITLTCPTGLVVCRGEVERL